MRHLSRSQRVLYLFVDSSIYSNGTKTRWDVSLATPGGRAVGGPLKLRAPSLKQAEPETRTLMRRDRFYSFLWFLGVNLSHSLIINQSFNQ